MAPSGDGVFDPADAVGRGLVDAAVAARDPELIEAGLRIYRRVLDRVDPVLRAAGASVLAFPSEVLRPGARRDCLVVVLPGSILVAWPHTPLQAGADVLEIDKRKVARVEIAPAPPLSRFLSVVTIEGAFGLCSVGLPRGATVFGLWMRDALQTDRR